MGSYEMLHAPYRTREKGGHLLSSKVPHTSVRVRVESIRVAPAHDGAIR